MKLDAFIARAEQLIKQTRQVERTRLDSAYGGSSWVDQGAFSGFRAAGLSYLKNLFEEHLRQLCSKESTISLTQV